METQSRPWLFGALTLGGFRFMGVGFCDDTAGGLLGRAPTGGATTEFDAPTPAGADGADGGAGGTSMAPVSSSVSCEVAGSGTGASTV